MNITGYHVRRATVDDLPILRTMWEKAEFPAEDLEPTFTQFQVVETPEGEIHAAIGLKLEKQQGLIHSDLFVKPDLENLLFPMIWQRLQSLAKNHGLFRLWTQLRHPYLLNCGFKEASPKLLEKLPAGFGNPQALWLSLSLRDENVSAVSIEKEFEAFAAAQKEETERLMKQARFLRTLAYVLVVIFSGILIAVGINIFRKGPLRKRGGLR